MNYKWNFLFAIVLCFTVASFFGCNPDDDIMIDPEVQCDSFFVDITMTFDSTLMATAAGGAEPYTFLWSTGETTSEINYQLDGSETYTVTVTDSNDCTATATFGSNDPTPCTLVADSITVSQDSIGSYVLTAGSTGGVAPLTYLWSTGETTSTIVTNTEGYYTVVIVDAMGCEVSAGVTIEGMMNPCEGLAGGIYTDTLSNNVLVTYAYGGTPPYVYTWSDGSTSETLENPVPGTTYSLTITDSNGCTVVSSYNYLGNEPCDLLTSSISVYPDSTSVNMTTLAANANGGTQPYSYAWSQGDNSQIVYVANSGSYSVTVTDQNGCVSESQIEL